MENKKLVIAGVVGLGLLIWFGIRPKSVSQSFVDADENEMFGNQGMNIPGYVGGDFISNIDVEVNPDLLGMLANKYMPLFGFVGTTTVGVPIYVPVQQTRTRNPCLDLPPPPVSRRDGQDELRLFEYRKRYGALIDQCNSSRARSGGFSNSRQNSQIRGG